MRQGCSRGMLISGTYVFFPGKNKKRDSWKLYVFGGGEYESESGV